MYSALTWLAFKALDLLQPVLFPYPRNSHVQTPLCRFPMLVYAHRGGALEPGGYVENTQRAFQNSARLKVHVLELDAQLTKDNHVVVFHDRTLGRMAGDAYKKKTIRDLPLGDLPTLTTHAPSQTAPVTPDVPLASALSSSTIPSPHGQTAKSSPHGPSEQEQDRLLAFRTDTVSKDEEAGTYQQLFKTFSPEKDAHIPLLSDIFRSFPDIPIQIDIKVNTPGLVDKVHELVVGQPQRRHRMLWGSFRHKVNCDMYEKDPHIPLFTSGWRAIYLRLAHAVGRMDQVHIYESVIIVPWRVPALWGRAKHWFPFLQRSWSEALAERGVSVVFFGADLNDWDAYRACILGGGSAVCTDRPALLQSFLAEHVDGPASGAGHAYSWNQARIKQQDDGADGTEVLQPLSVDADRLCQHTGSKTALPCVVCRGDVCDKS